MIKRTAKANEVKELTLKLRLTLLPSSVRLNEYELE